MELICIKKKLLVPVVTLLFCEFFIYYFVLCQCTWPKFKNEMEEKNNNLVKAMLLADPHLLGPYRGHWFDKLRREWQMYRAFQSAISIHHPDVIFVLGDLFDEGKWCTETQFNDYVSRFMYLFEVPKEIELYVVPGNHDIGFHYALNHNSVKKFERTFNSSSVQLLNIKDNHVVLINSMAMEGDGCYFCSKAEKRILKLGRDLNCLKKNPSCKGNSKLKHYSRPIVLQHFPMFRESDSNCQEIDGAQKRIKYEPFRPKWDCLSKRSSEMIFSELHPRLIIDGHIHHGCHIIHKKDIHEYTLPSFSWRNKNNPSYMLAKFTPSDFVLQKCEMPKESTVILIYFTVLVSSTFWATFQALKKFL